MRSLDAMLNWTGLPAVFRRGASRNGDGRHRGMPAAPTPAAVDAARPVPGPCEPPWLAQLDRAGIPRSLRYPTTTLGRILDQAADRFADNPALVYNDTRWTYRELLARANRVAGGLSRLGVQPGDRVLLTLPNCPEYILCFFAIQKLGAIVVNAGPLMGADDLAALMLLTTPGVVIGLDLQAPQILRGLDGHSPGHFLWVTLQSYQPLFQRVGYQFKLWQGRVRHDQGASDHTTLARLLENAPAKPPTVEPKPDALAVLQPTSGTTGSLKLVQVSHRNLLANATQVAVWIGSSDGQESVLVALPMFHSYGLLAGLINPVLRASRIILMTRFKAGQALDLIAAEHPTVFPLVPAICDALSDEIEKRAQPLPPPGLRCCVSGAAPLPQRTAERFERLAGGRVVEGYGLSESSPVTHINPLGHPREGSIGLPLPDTLCRIVDLADAARDLPVGEAGELLVSGPQVMSGYYHNPDETRRSLWTDPVDGRAWLLTGDIARMDQDGFFQIVDRKKDMIIRSGMKVYPAKVERVLLAHDRVADAAVIGRPDPPHTECVCAFVVPRRAEDTIPPTGHDDLAEMLRAYCRSHLASYEVPTDIAFLDRIPRSALGKTLKKELRLRAPSRTADDASPSQVPDQEAT